MYWAFSSLCLQCYLYILCSLEGVLIVYAVGTSEEPNTGIVVVYVKMGMDAVDMST